MCLDILDKPTPKIINFVTEMTLKYKNAVNLSYDGGGPYVPPPQVFLFFY